MKNKLWSRLKNTSKTIRFKLFLILTVFVLIYMVTFSFFFIHSVRTMKDKILNSYDNMLSLYVNQLKSQIQDTNSFLDNLNNNFDVNMMAIEAPDSEEYSLTRFRIYNSIRVNYSIIGILNSVYVYDGRTDSFLMIPDDKGRFQSVGRKILGEPEEKIGKWCMVQENGNYTLVKKCKASESLWIIAFMRMEEIAQGLKSIAGREDFLWDISNRGGEIICSNYLETEEASARNLSFRYSEIEKGYDGIGLTFRLLVKNDSIWMQNLWLALFFPLSILLFFLILWVVLFGLRKRFLEPLDLLIGGMQDFAGGIENVRLSIDRNIEYELAFTINIFNDMVCQIEKNRFLIYEEKLERQKLLIQNLQAQIDPHFFSNTLNLIYNLIAANRHDVARKCLLLLSSYYRYMTRIGQKQIGLEKEFDFICNYLEIMKLRFPGKLSSSVTLEEKLKNLQIPPMLIQPLVENCTKHGFIDRSHIFSMEIEAIVAEGSAIIRVTDNGCGFPEEYRGIFDQNRALPEKENPEEDNHVGLCNIYQRLIYFYGEDAKMMIDWTGNRTWVQIIIQCWENYQ